jgi:hypothetical protein
VINKVEINNYVTTYTKYQKWKHLESILYKSEFVSAF